MNQYFLEQKKQRELFISVGFVIEVVLFILSGFFLAWFSWFAFVFLALAMWVASIVGDKIARNSILNYKWGV